MSIPVTVSTLLEAVRGKGIDSLLVLGRGAAVQVVGMLVLVHVNDLRSDILAAILANEPPRILP